MDQKFVSEKSRSEETNLPVVRKAVRGDLGKLNELAVGSEAYWGYDEDHMSAFKRRYAIRNNHLEKGHVFVIEKNGGILGFYHLTAKESGFELEHFYIDPRYLGKGLGQTLWGHLRAFCIHRRIREVTIVCNDLVKVFYLKMGAAFLGRIESKVDRGTMIAKLKYRMNPAHSR